MPETVTLEELESLPKYDCEDVPCFGGYETKAEMILYPESGDYVKIEDIRELFKNKKG